MIGTKSPVIPTASRLKVNCLSHADRRRGDYGLSLHGNIGNLVRPRNAVLVNVTVRPAVLCHDPIDLLGVDTDVLTRGGAVKAAKGCLAKTQRIMNRFGEFCGVARRTKIHVVPAA